jgi:hypothetical protein
LVLPPLLEVPETPALWAGTTWWGGLIESSLWDPRFWGGSQFMHLTH